MTPPPIWSAFNDLYVVFLIVFSATSLSRRRWPTQVLLFAVLIGLVTALKVATAVLRPDGSDRRSFPSGHAAAAFYVAALSHFRPVVTLWAGLASLARVVLRRHRWVDIGVGAVLGTVFGTLA
jgi:membrane-associated phospholipid phosphatase